MNQFKGRTLIVGEVTVVLNKSMSLCQRRLSQIMLNMAQALHLYALSRCKLSHEKSLQKKNDLILWTCTKLFENNETRLKFEQFLGSTN